MDIFDSAGFWTVYILLIGTDFHIPCELCETFVLFFVMSISYSYLYMLRTPQKIVFVFVIASVMNFTENSYSYPLPTFHICIRIH